MDRAPSPPVSRLLALLIALLIALLASSCEPAQRKPTLLAASSFQDAVGALQAQRPRGLISMHAASSVLARQIIAGTEADVFVSADAQWMQAVADQGLLVSGTRQALVGNRLVLVVRKGATVDLTQFEGKLAMGDPSHVPAGRYGEQALRALGLWERLGASVIAAADVRQALRLVEIGEAELGLVYATDAKASEAVEVLRVLEGEGVPAVVYEIGLLQGGDPAVFDRFVAPAALEVYRGMGFVDPPR